MRVEPLLLSRGVSSEKPLELEPVAKSHEENGKNKPERDGRSDLNRLVDKSNQASQLFDHHMQFKMDDKDNTVIQIVDDRTGKIVNEIPPEKLMEMLDQLASTVGIIIDKYV